MASLLYAHLDADQLRELVWPFKDLWGDKRKAVRDYLKKIWKENVVTHTVETNYENAIKEAELILEWWWKNRYGKQGSRQLNNYPEDFGRFLLRAYNDTQSVNPGDNVGVYRF